MADCFVTCRASRRALLVLMGGVIILTKLWTDLSLHARSWHDTPRSRSLNTISITNTTTQALRGVLSSTFPVPELNEESASKQNSKYAYAFVIGGCDPKKPTYRGFLYNILVATRLLREQGSTADVVAFFQLSYDYHDSVELPEQDVRALQAMNVHIEYIPQSPHESFYETVMSKFRILTLTQYKRVLLMDGDVLPLGNIDYLFELSDDNAFGPGNSTLKPNVVVAGPFEPSNAGFFMLAPGPGEYERITEIIRQRETAAEEKGVKFDKVAGWGHEIQPGDEWYSRKKSGSEWDFHFAFSDQVYHWTKYVKQDVSIVYQSKVENWAANENGQVALEQTIREPFKGHSKPLILQHGACVRFLCDYTHFSGTHKPWLKTPTHPKQGSKPSTGTEIWWALLKRINQDIDLGLDFDNWTPIGRPTHGLYAKYNDMEKKQKKLKESKATK